MCYLGLSAQFLVAVGLSRFCSLSQTEVKSSRSSSIASVQPSPPSPSIKDSACTFSINSKFRHSNIPTEWTSPNSSLNRMRESDSSGDRSAPGDDRDPLLSPLLIYSDSSRDQSVRRDSEQWSLGMRQRVTIWYQKVFSFFWIVTYLSNPYATVISVVWNEYIAQFCPSICKKIVPVISIVLFSKYVVYLFTIYD